jgi:DNA mismatch endonuclease, patch repair protein
MADVVDSATRSRMMAGIRGTDTKPEIELRRALHALGFRFRTNVQTLPGKPDIVLTRWKAVILVHGCFWHRHRGCRFATVPATRPSFWTSKFDANVSRDVRDEAALTQAGWRVGIVWECALKERGACASADQVSTWLRSGKPRFELASDSANHGTKEVCHGTGT